MFLKIKTKDLIAIKDPYQSNELMFNPPISKEDVKIAIDTQDIFEVKEKSERENAISKVAFFVSNKEFIKITLNNDEIVEADLFHLYAATFDENEQIIIEINSSQMPSKIEGVIVDKHDTKKYFKKIFEWKNIHSEEYNKWNDKDFIHNYISYANSGQRIEVYKFAHNDLWKDSEFILKLLSSDHEFINKCSKNFLYKKEIFEFVKTNNKYMVRYIDAYVDFKNGRKATFPVEDSDVNPDAKEYIHERLENEVLNNKEQMLELVKTMYFAHFEYLPLEIKKDLDVVNAFIDSCRDRKVSIVPNMLPKEVFQNEEFVKKFIKNNFLKDFFIDMKKYSNLYENWINDKQKIIEYSQLTKNNSSDYRNVDKGKLVKANDPYLDFYDVLPDSLKADKDVLKVFINKNPKLYYKLPKSIRNNKDLFLTSLNPTEDYMGNDISVNKLNDLIIDSLTKEEIIKVIQITPSVVLKNENTLKWAEIPEVVMYLGKLFDEITIKKEVLDELYRDESKVLHLIKDKRDLYEKMDENIQSYHSVALQYISYNHKNVIKVPKKLFNSIDFCAKVISLTKGANIEVLNLCPKNFWEDPNFILKIAKQIDEKNLNVSIFNEYAKDVANILNTNTEHKKIESIREYLEKYIMQLSLHENLQTEKKSLKRNKI